MKLPRIEIDSAGSDFQYFHNLRHTLFKHTARFSLEEEGFVDGDTRIRSHGAKRRRKQEQCAVCLGDALSFHVAEHDGARHRDSVFPAWIIWPDDERAIGQMEPIKAAPYGDDLFFVLHIDGWSILTAHVFQDRKSTRLNSTHTS